MILGCCNNPLQAQNYKLFIPFTDYLYSYNQNFYKGFRITDAQPIHLSDTVYHASAETFVEGLSTGCFHPIDYSWISPEIIRHSNGNYVLFNYRHDSIVIKTLAGLNDSWRLYSFKNGSFIQAKISKADTFTFLALTDSVKTIVFEYYDSLGIKKSYLTDNLSIKISKNYGLIHTLNFACFPDIVLNSNEIENFNLESYGLTGISGKIGIMNPGKKAFFDFQPGDELHTLHVTLIYGGYDSIKTRTIILNRTENSTEVNYQIHEKIKRKNNYNQNHTDTTIFSESIRWIKYNLNDSYFNQLPSNQSEKIYTKSFVVSTSYLSTDSSGKFIKSFPKYSIYDSGIGTCYHVGPNDGADCAYNYMEGLGGPYYDYCPGLASLEVRKLVFYKKGNITWGTPLSIDNFGETEKTQLKFYPNPWNTEAYFTITSPEIYTLVIYNPQGKITSGFNGKAGYSEVKLKRGNYQPGIYFYLFLTKTGQKNTGKFIVE